MEAIKRRKADVLLPVVVTGAASECVMQCPEPIHDILCEILGYGVLRARLAAWNGDAPLAAIEADHIHNLSELLRHYSEARLEYYWSCERPMFLERVGAENAHRFQELWDALAELVPDSADGVPDNDR